MGFLTPALLGGMALIAVPILLHLIMRRQPQKIIFPALQFVRKRQRANQRRLNVRQWLLLALRCLLIAGLAIALARPTLKGSGLRGKEGAPLAVALVIDNSLRMQYVFENQTRQEEAAELATWLVKRLPEDAEVAVMDRSRSSGGFVVDLATAEARLGNLLPETSPRRLEDAVREAVELVADQPDHRQEVFLFSDMNAAEWDEVTSEAINETLAEAPDVRLYFVDVGVEQPRNMALGQIEMRSNTLRPGQLLHLEVPVQVEGIAEEPLVELYVEQASGKPVKRGQQIVEIDEQGLGQAVFELGDLPLGIHQGSVRLATSDSLEMDNARYFSVEVQPPAQVLLLGEEKSDTLFLREALSPALISDRSTVRFVCTEQTFSQATSVAFDDYDVVCLLDPAPLSEGLVKQLIDYVYNGGGLGVFLGHRAKLSGFNETALQDLMPGKLKLRSRRATYLRPRSLAHPALAGLRDYAENIPWEVYPIWKYWEFAELVGDHYVVARFANGKPALLERSIGQGRVLTLATPISDPLQPPGREPWNLLPTGPEPWPFVALSNQLVGYLAQHENESLSYLAGETVNLRLSPKQRVSGYILDQPNAEAIRRTLSANEDAIRIGTTRALGNYRIASGRSSSQLQMGFSINASEEFSRLERVDAEQLVKAFPKDRVELASNLEDVKRYVDIGRSGRELFSWAITFVCLVWSSEYLLSNRFYGSKT